MANRAGDPEAIGDAVEDVARACGGEGMQANRKEHVTPAGAAADADLVVEVLARRSQKEFGGGKTDPARFAQVPVSYRAKKFMLAAWKIASPTPERPVFMFEGYNGGGTPFGCHGAAANSASQAIDKFVEGNYATLTGK